MLRLVTWVTVFMLPVSVAMAEPIPGDLDKDGDVDFADFLQFAANFGKTGSPPEAPEPRVVRDTTVVIVRDTIMVAAKCEKVSVSLLTPSRIGPVQAGKPSRNRIKVKVIGEGGVSVGGVAWRWETDEYSGWVFPFEGVTEDDGLIDVRWVAGSPGEGVLSLSVGNAILENPVEIETVSVVSSGPPHSAVNVWFNHERRASAYSADLTPLTEPHGTYYAIVWDGGYMGLQRGGSRYDRQLQFSVWDTPDNIDAEVIERGEGVICRTFGGEGTGRACEFNYPWEVGKTYRFEVAETVLRGGSVFTVYVTNLETEKRRFVGKLRYGVRADLRYANVFTEDFARSAPTCLAQPVRSAAFGRVMAKIDGAWQQLRQAWVGQFGEDSGNPGTLACANRAVRLHEKGLELVIGGRNVADPDGPRRITVP